MISPLTSCLHNVPGWVQKHQKRKNEAAFIQTRKERTKKQKAQTRKKQEQLNKRLVFICY